MHRGGFRGRGRGGKPGVPRDGASIPSDKTQEPTQTHSTAKAAPDKKPHHFPKASSEQTGSRTPPPLVYNAYVTLHIWVPVEEVHLAQRAAKESSIHFTITRDAGASSSAWRGMELDGEASAVFKAAENIAAAVEEIDDCVLSFRTLADRVALLRGEEANTVKTSSITSNTRIYIPPADSTEAITLEGDLAGVALGFGLLVEPLMRGAARPSTETFSIPGDLIGPVVGTKGNSLREIMMACGCCIDVVPVFAAKPAKKTDETQEAPRQRAETGNVTLNGPTDCVAMARSVVDVLKRSKPAAPVFSIHDAINEARGISQAQGLFVARSPPQAHGVPPVGATAPATTAAATAAGGKVALNPYKPEKTPAVVKYDLEGNPADTTPPKAAPVVPELSGAPTVTAAATTASAPQKVLAPAPKPAPTSFVSALTGVVVAPPPPVKAAHAANATLKPAASPAPAPTPATNHVATRGRGGRGRGGAHVPRPSPSKTEDAGKLAAQPVVVHEKVADAKRAEAPATTSRGGRGGKRGGHVTPASDADEVTAPTAEAKPSRGAFRGRGRGGARGGHTATVAKTAVEATG